MKKQLLLGAALFLSVLAGSELMAQAAVSVDPFVYTPRGANQEMKLTNKWMYSNVLENYKAAADLLAPSGTVRGATAKEGVMLFIDRNSKQIIRVNGETGARLTPLKLASNFFTYTGRNKANTADSTWTAGTLTHNDIKVDNAGNVLVANLITSNAGRFQVWKVNMTDGTGTLVIDQADLATLFPGATTLRFDAFGVWGDVNGKAIIMAANASTTAMEAYKWDITGGVAGAPSLIELDNSKETGKDFAELANLGSAPQILPLDENYYYIDGNATLPVLCDMEGNVVDGFKANIGKTIDSVTVAGTKLNMNQGHNGLAEFEIDGKYFIVMASTNTAGTPASSFRLFQFADAGKEFSGLTCLWTFPRAGMGGASNAYRTAMPTVEVSGKKAKIYVYTGENGYGMYEFEIGAPSSTPSTTLDALTVRSENARIYLSSEVATATVYTTNGQLVKQLTNVSEFSLANTGVYLVKITDAQGNHKTCKVILN